ncbi:MAG: SDR family oxidoreductase [Muricomes sp.]
MYDLTGKVAVVTGASSGLGADAARAYAQAGANVALLARRKEKLEALSEELKAMGVDAQAVCCDVSDEESVSLAISEVIAHFGKIDILLNNAGIAVRGGVDTLTVEDWDKSMDINVKGIFLVSKYVVPEMKKQNYGKIVNISSVNALIGDKNDIFIRHSYNASKSAVLGLSLGMAASYGQFGITVNSVCPGLFESEMTEGTLFKSQDFLNAYSYTCPMSRPGKRGEVSGPILFFSSDASSYVTGQHIVVDGGTSLV